MKRIFTLEPWLPSSPKERLEVSDEPIASDLDALEREDQLRKLEPYRDRSAGWMRRSGGNPRRREMRRAGRTLSRLDQALKSLREQLAVWQVQEEQ